MKNQIRFFVRDLFLFFTQGRAGSSLPPRTGQAIRIWLELCPVGKRKQCQQTSHTALIFIFRAFPLSIHVFEGIRPEIFKAGTGAAKGVACKSHQDTDEYHATPPGRGR
jgi:hypothetical protein